jgi:hypothetical protein
MAKVAQLVGAILVAVGLVAYVATAASRMPLLLRSHPSWPCSCWPSTWRSASGPSCARGERASWRPPPAVHAAHRLIACALPP